MLASNDFIKEYLTIIFEGNERNYQVIAKVLRSESKAVLKDSQISNLFKAAKDLNVKTKSGMPLNDAISEIIQCLQILFTEDNNKEEKKEEKPADSAENPSDEAPENNNETPAK